PGSDVDLPRCGRGRQLRGGAPIEHAARNGQPQALQAYTCGRSYSTGRAASWCSPMQAAPMSPRASAFSRMLRKPSAPASGEYTAPTGELIVTAPVSLGRIYLIPILADFLKAYPDIEVSLILTDRVLSLFQEQIDVGLRVGALSDSIMIAIRVGAIRHVV